MSVRLHTMPKGCVPNTMPGRALLNCQFMSVRSVALPSIEKGLERRTNSALRVASQRSITTARNTSGGRRRTCSWRSMGSPSMTTSLSRMLRMARAGSVVAMSREAAIGRGNTPRTFGFTSITTMTRARSVAFSAALATVRSAFSTTTPLCSARRRLIWWVLVDRVEVF